MRLSLLTLLLATLPAPLLADAPVVIRFSHVAAADTPKGKAADHFRQLVDERSKGRAKVEVYPNSQLYKDREELEALQLGMVQMLAPSMSKFNALGVRELELFDLPYLFDNLDAVHRLTQGAVGARLLGSLENKGIKGLAFWDNGLKNFSANRPLRSPADFRGLKMRIQPSRALDAQMRALGAIPQPMAFADVFAALQNRTVDGTENPDSNFYTQKMHRVQPYLTVSGHGYVGYVVVVNKKFWDSLAPDLRNVREEAMKDATRYAADIAQQENDTALQAVRQTGKTQIITLTADQRQALKTALLPVHRQMAGRIGEPLLQAAYQATGFRPPH